MVQFLFLYDDWALLALRVILGVILIAHGWPKIKDLRATAGNFENMGFKPGIYWGSIAATVEFFGGILIIAGFLTQLVAALVAIQLVVATWFLRFKLNKWLVGGYEFELLLIATALALVTLGGGTYSLDDFFFIFLY